MVVLEDVHIHGQKAQALQDSGFLCYLISIMSAVGRALQNLLCFMSESSSSAYKFTNKFYFGCMIIYLLKLFFGVRFCNFVKCD